ncbi:hypothetical protein BLNAU_17969 [Blattamonas nauphoetae]|uniref:Uncharacterized protein n=1 Tax=Blattamonas nauphoetae TaxID=2049346 RepID=A0ABQ9X5R6_9EUKA|nr:hypothetical protein BLNAU_17969 [Blattamonas nauphoetae]
MANNLHEASICLSNRFISLIGHAETRIVPSSNKADPLFTLHNCTFSLKNSQLFPHEYAFRLDFSYLSLVQTTLHVISPCSPIVSSHSQVILESITISSPSHYLSSFVECDTTPNEVTALQMYIHDHIISRGSPVFASVDTRIVRQMNNKLANLTQLGSTTAKHSSSYPTQTMMLGSTMCCVESPLYGCVISDINTGGKFLLLNSTFTLSTASYMNQEYTHENRLNDISSESSLSFTNCTFTSCSTEGGGGGFYYFRHSGALTVTDCKFFSCRARIDGGAFATYYARSAQLSNTLFDACRAQGIAGGPVMNGGTETCEITFSNFTECYGEKGSGLHRNTQSQVDSLTQFSNCRIVGCVSKNGASFQTVASCGCVYFDTIKHLSAHSNLFTQNQVGSQGLVLSIVHLPIFSFDVRDNTFEANTLTPVGTVYPDALYDVMESISSNIILERSWILTGSLFSTPTDLDAISDSGSPLRVCLQTSSASATYTVPSSFSYPYLFHVSNQTTFTILSSFSLNLEDCPSAGICSVSEGASATISLTSLTPSTSPTDANLFVVDNANLTFHDTNLQTLVFSSKSVLNVKGASTVLVSGVTTSSITQSSPTAEGGCFLCVEGQSTASVTISNSLFGDCSTPGHGGWGRCDFGEEGQLIIEDSSFGQDCAQGNGHRLFVSHSHLNIFVQSVDWTVFGVPTVLPQTKDDADALLGLVFGMESEESFGSILLYLFPHSADDDAVHVHSSGHSHLNCGKKQLPCLKLTDSLTKVKGDQGIMVDSSLTLSNQVVIVNRTMRIKSSTPATTILTLALSSSFVVEEETLRFSLITLQLDSTLSSTPFVVCGGSLILTNTSTGI